MQTIEVDLHIEKLMNNLHGLTPADKLMYQIDTFKKKMTEHKKHRGFRIVFIHGVGSGKLKSSIENLLKKDYKQHQYYDASTINPIKYNIHTAIAVKIS